MLGGRRRFGNLNSASRPPQWFNRACDAGPQSAFFVAQGPPPAHRTRQVLDAAALARSGDGIGAAAGAVTGLGSGKGTSSAVGSIMLPPPNCARLLRRSGGNGTF